MDSSFEIKRRLETLLPDAREIMKISCCPGAAIAVIHDGKLFHSKYIGYRDVENKLPMDPFTVVPIASLTKAFFSQTAAICEYEKKFTWVTPIKNILPDFRPESEILYQKMTMVDALSHRAGIENPFYWAGCMNDNLIPQENNIAFINGLKQVGQFRGEFRYCNPGYDIAARALTTVNGAPWNDILHSRIFQPLSMSRTSTDAAFRPDDNVAKAYCTLDDATPVEVTPMRTGHDTIGGAGSAIRSCMDDLVRYYEVLLHSYTDQVKNNTAETPGSPLKQVPFLFSPQISMNGVSMDKASYGLGWACVPTPAPMGQIGHNPLLMGPEGMPEVAKDHPSELIFYHQGSMAGTLAAVALIPSSKAAIVVLTNGLSLNDTPDWLIQMYLEAYLRVVKKNNYVALAKQTADAARRCHPNLVTQLAREQYSGTHPRDFLEYTGDFYNKAKTMIIRISLEERGALKMAFQGLDTEIFPLTHYHYDVFTWLQPRNEFARRGRFTCHDVNYFKLSFGSSNEGDRIDHLTWWHDAHLQEPEMFRRVGS